MKIRANENIGEWILREVLGRGGNAQVWLVEDQNKNNFAMKILTVTKDLPLERFRREIEFLKNNPHRNIIPLKNDHTPPTPSKTDRPYYVMPLAEPYENVWCRKSWVDIIEDFIAMGKALAVIHEKEVSHRDIKIENILYYNNNPMLADFGLVKGPDDDNITEERRDVGSKFTMAPEMRRCPHESDGRPADVYSFAKTLWVALTKEKRCFDGQLTDDNSLNHYNHNNNLYLPPLDNLIRLATSNTPEDRPTIKDFLSKLNLFLHTSFVLDERISTSWRDLCQLIFPVGTPEIAKWSKLEDIIDVLNIFSKIDTHNYMMYNDGDGNYLKGCISPKENGFIELCTEDKWPLILKPSCLTFHSFGDDPKLDCFRLKVADTPRIVKVEDTSLLALPESLFELPSGEYVYDDGTSTPVNSRRILRCHTGIITIYSTNSIYNKLGCHIDDILCKDVSDEKFREFSKSLKYNT